MMTYADLTGKTSDELRKMLVDLKKEQMEQRFKHAGGQMDKTHEIGALRKKIARVQTAMNALKTKTEKAA